MLPKGFSLHLLLFFSQASCRQIIYQPQIFRRCFVFILAAVLPELLFFFYFGLARSNAERLGQTDKCPYH